ncbi:MAG: hypothetical protein EZS28_012364 [Streblomastix strix]|uniref:Uncharacterized protein n=1 Tax=Streblomastix strix TaxID=222440 RepID=A0A5J4WAY0_9EUKA|nr:MAG: hypothetical protein EZS28_012364 [Streblomastix strix]
MFQFFEILIQVVQCVGVAYRVFDWPLHGIVNRTILDFFGETWRSNTFLLTQTLIMGILLIAVIFSMLVLTMLVKRGILVHHLILEIVHLCFVLITGIFYLPTVNVFLGGLLCYTQIKDDPSTIPKISCNGQQTAVFLVGIAFFLVSFVLTFLIRLFDFKHDHKKGGIFTQQTGFYNIYIMIVTTAVQITGIAFRGELLVVSIFGIVVFLFLAIYPCIFVPYFNVWGNVVQGIAMQICFVPFTMGIFFIYLDQSKSYITIIEWLIFAILIMLLPLFNAIITYKRIVSLWAVHADEETPLPFILMHKDQRNKMKSIKCIHTQESDEKNSSVSDIGNKDQKADNQQMNMQERIISKSTPKKSFTRYFYDQRMEQIQGSQQSKAHDNQAKRYYQYSKAYISSAYIMLAKDNLDLSKIMAYIDQAIVNEKYARQILEDLLLRHPKSVELIRTYGRDDDMALQLFDKANDIEQQEKERTDRSTAKLNDNV